MSDKISMRFSLQRILWAVVVAAGFTALGCAKGTYLEINFTGPELPPIYAIALNVTLTGTDGIIQTPSQCGANGYCIIQRAGMDKLITLPTSAALKLDGETGSLKLDAAALNMAGDVAGTASRTTVIMPEETWAIDLNLVPGTAASP